MNQTDYLIINSLNVATQIGVHEWEKRIKQSLLIDISIPFDFSLCEDDLAKTIDYAVLCQTVTAFVESRSFQLIETVANTVAQLIEERFKISQLTIKVSKPHAVKNAGLIQVVVHKGI
jgi:dihydroneopterin aldolase